MAPSRDAVYTSGAPKPPPFLSQAIKDGGRVYCSGQVGMNPQTGKMVEGTVQDRTRQVLQNLAAVLEAAGSDLSSVIKVNIFLTDMGDFAAMNDVYDAFFSEPKPVGCI
ncbi:putative l-psp endoribonuclease family protein [Diplodia seriata]|uniref:Putative l-psp endoribonuclease family protein n=1 Tax=Diplodia seriata TaxID=420778 RepID=A0A0G2GXC6_9PEZI|nr:putative l-psp endoribonuclease family protein [Diplodia seriata]